MADASTHARRRLAAQSLYALAVRLYVGGEYLRAGYLKIMSWGGTLYLFSSQYHLPGLSPTAAAVTLTASELLFPALLVLGWLGRLAAAGVFVVNVLAVVSYSQVLLAPGAGAVLSLHVLWGIFLVPLIMGGAGRFSVDRWSQQPK